MTSASDRAGDGPERGGDRDGQSDREPEPEQSALSADVIHIGGDWSALPSVEDLVRGVVGALLLEVDLGDEPATVAVALSSDAHVHELNRTHRGKDAPTNVLSFPAEPIARPPGEPDFLGDVVLAVETLAREAAADGKPIAHHFQHLVLHGLLHLADFDHETDEDAAEMEAIEVAVLARLAIPDPYATVEAEEQRPCA